MKKNYTKFLAFSLLVSMTFLSKAQTSTVLATQDFEVVPATPTWSFTGPVIYNSGFSMATAAPPSSPIGIAGSRAWETTTNSGGLILDFANITIPPIYDSVRVHFNLAAMCLTSSSGGPDNLDYVRVEYSIDGGATFVSRIRVKGGLGNNTFWEYAATGLAKKYFTPTTETVFEPAGTGLQTTEGYSNVEIVFPGSVTQIMLRITCRSSSSTDTWLVDNVTITGETLITGIAENEEGTFKAFPNPAEGNITLQFEKAGNRNIEIMNITGQVLSMVQSPDSSISLQLPEARGMYMIRVSSENGVSTKRIVKQ